MEKIFIICSGLEPQKDGIGDYTRTIANELSSKYDVVVCAINDDFVSERSLAFDIYHSVRLPSTSLWSTRTLQLANLLEEHQPIWVSLQLAPFGLHKKGIIYEAAKCLKTCLKTFKIHIFAHELWLGAEDGATLKMKLWGKVIKYFLIRLIKKLSPSKVYVSCEINHFLLQKEGIDNDIVPVFSNILVEKIVDPSLMVKKISKNIQLNIENNSSQFLIIGFFGVIHPYWNPDEIFKQLDILAKLLQKRLLFLFIGKIPEAGVSKVVGLLPMNALHYSTGMLDNNEISGFIQLCTAGITSNPEIMLGKSGSVAAFLVHQKPLIVYKNNIKVSGFKLDRPLSNLILYPSQINAALLSLMPCENDFQKFESKPLVLKMRVDMKA